MRFENIILDILRVLPKSVLKLIAGPPLVIDGNQLDLNIQVAEKLSEKEMKNRMSKISKNKKVVYERGYKSLYQKNVLPATLGCDFNFLQNKKIK